jgi:hypothetical protein
MSVLAMYNSIPPGSSLYFHLEQDYSLTHLVGSIVSYNGGVFNFFDMDDEEINEALESTYEYLIRENPGTDRNVPIFTSEMHFQQVVSQLRADVSQTREAYPGIEYREAMLNKITLDMAKSLPLEMTRLQAENPEQTAHYLIYGDKIIGTEFGLEAISRNLVHEGANILRQVDSRALLTHAGGDPSDSGAIEEFERWCNLYIAADENNEEIMVVFE